MDESSLSDVAKRGVGVLVVIVRKRKVSASFIVKLGAPRREQYSDSRPEQALEPYTERTRQDGLGIQIGHCEVFRAGSRARLLYSDTPPEVSFHGTFL